VKYKEWRTRMDKAVPHGPDEPCTCKGCWACAGREQGCTCDINWDEMRFLDSIEIERGQQ